MRKMRSRVAARAEEQVSDRVRKWMTVRKIDQKDLAESLEVSEGYISRILNGHRVWTVNLLLRTAAALDVPVTELDPACGACLKQDLLNLELRGDVPQLKVVYSFIKSLPKITQASDLEALATVLQAFASREARAA